MKFNCYIENDKNSWDIFNKKSKLDFFVDYEWNTLVCKEMNCEFIPLVIENKYKKIQICLYKKGSDYEGTILGYSGIISDKGNINIIDVICAVKESLNTNIKNITINPTKNDINLSFSNYLNSHTYLLRLGNDFEKIWNECSGKARTSVRFAKKNDVKVEKVNIENIDIFYDIYKKEQSRKNENCF